MDYETYERVAHILRKGEPEVDIHFDCVFYYVRDLDHSIPFYSEILGLELKSRDAVARFDVDGVLLELVPVSDETTIDGNGNARVCLRVSDIASAVNQLRANGVCAGETRAVENGLVAGFKDPDGNELTLWQYV